MAKRLFVDVDDTLVKYSDHTDQKSHYPYQQGTPWTPNEPLIAGIKQYRADHKDDMIVVWSGGGREYAQMWIDRLLPGLGIVGMGKSSDLAETMVRSQDIVVDDIIDFPCAARVFGPDEWPQAQS